MLPVALANAKGTECFRCDYIPLSIQSKWYNGGVGITKGDTSEQLLLNSPILPKTQKRVKRFIKHDGNKAERETSSAWRVGRVRRRVYLEKLHD